MIGPWQTSKKIHSMEQTSTESSAPASEILFNPGLERKKKIKKPVTTELSTTLTSSEETAKPSGEYTYEELVERFYSILRANNPDLIGEKRKFTLVPPQVVRESSKKTAFCNIEEISKRLKRPMEHVQCFVLAELGTTGNNDAQQRLIIRGRFQQLQIENILKKYIMEYVTCRTCRSGETLMTKDNRLNFVTCESCGSQRSVASIKTGFTAQTTKRSILRAAN